MRGLRVQRRDQLKPRHKGIKGRQTMPTLSRVGGRTWALKVACDTSCACSGARHRVNDGKACRALCSELRVSTDCQSCPHWTAIARIPCQQNMPFKMTSEKRWSRLVQSVHLCAGRRATKHRINTSLRNKHLGDTTRPIREQSNCAAPFWSSILGEGFKPESQDNCGGITAQDADNARGHAR